MQITKAQIKIIHCLKGALKLSDEDYRSRVMGHSSGFDGSSLSLSYAEAAALTKDMEKEAVERGVWTKHTPESPLDRGDKKKKYDNLGHRPGMASPAQLRLIEFMWAQKSFLHDPAQRAQALRHYCFRITKRDDLTFLESRDASKLIKSIESMKKGGKSEINNSKIMCWLRDDLRPAPQPDLRDKGHDAMPGVRE
ncbi:MAG: DUF1018 domain-containing protein [Nitrospirae bacterium]|nr:DUF1018 domain-containing protein [Nitrospirota bacterium]